jgi:hypothetical protein
MDSACFLHPATAGLPVLEVSVGPGAVIVSISDDGRTIGTVFHPDRADELAVEVARKAAEARRLLEATTRAIPPLGT